MINTKLYQRDVAILKDYNGKMKLVVCNTVRTKGIELTDEEKRKRTENRGKVNSEKLENNLSRTKSLIFEYAMCNEWDYFITLTLDPKKYDRFNLKQYVKDLGQFIRDYRKKHNINFAYLLLPEEHQDGAWHMHGLIKGLSLEHLTLFTLNDKLPYKVLDSIREGQRIYNWTAYAEKFGYCTLSQIKDNERIASYITKYISKDLHGRKDDINAKLFYSSRGLKKAEEVKRGYLNTEITPQFKNDYCSIVWFDKSIPVDYIKNLIE